MFNNLPGNWGTLPEPATCHLEVLWSDNWLMDMVI